MTTGIADVQARIAQIQSQFMAPPAPPSVDASALSFEDMLAAAEGEYGGAAAGDGNKVVETAKKYLGVPYVWGGTDPSKGLDCSGFVQRVYKDLGINLPRTSGEQAKVGREVGSLSAAQPGDLVVFDMTAKRAGIDHIGIYVGDGQMIVAPKSGDVVKIQKITEEPVTIRRVLGAEPARATYKAAAAGSATSPSQFDDLFRQAGTKHGVDPALLQAVARVESNLNPGAVSKAGAQGLMQIMPSTAKGLGVNPLDPAQAVDGAARLLASHQRRFGSLELSLAAYNAGPNAVARHNGIPPYRETQQYVQKVLTQFQRGSL